MPKLLTEFVGTFFLVLTVGLAGAQPLGAVAIGAVLMVMVYMGGHVSGAHYNPAVTLAAAMAGKHAWKDVLPYWAAQATGALVAVLGVMAIAGASFAPAPALTASPMAPWLVEILFTLALALVVLNVAMHPATKGNSFYGLAIGLTVTAGAVAGGGISGGAFNPAVGVVPTLVHGWASGAGMGALPLYLVAPCLGAAVAALIFRRQE